MKGYGKFLDGIEKIEKLFLAVTVAIMIIVITYQVILRYVFSASNAWSEELARYLFIYDVMVAAAIATRRNSHLQVDAFIGILKPRTKAIYTVIATIVGIVFLVFLFCYSGAYHSAFHYIDRICEHYGFVRIQAVCRLCHSRYPDGSRSDYLCVVLW